MDVSFSKLKMIILWKSLITLQNNLQNENFKRRERRRIHPQKYVTYILIKLTGSQYKLFTEALLDAFPSQQRLTELVKYQFGKNLNVIAMGADLKEIVFKLIQASEAEGWTDKLIAGARDISLQFQNL